MKKVLLTFGIILVALAVMAPAPEKAEKLKVEDNDWDSETAQFVV
jgi:ABC-type proline/glycine betaine transport system substrate-binding protein